MSALKLTGRFMKKEYKLEYDNIVKDIINNEYFLKTKDDLHHGSSKYEHLVRVSKCSFIMAKMFNADVESTTRAALLHDFFFGGRKDKVENSYLNHPKTAVENAKKYFEINEIEENAIRTHMFHHVLIKKIFPFINRSEKAKIKDNKPKSKEGWIVCIADLLVSIVECQRFEFSYIANLSYLIIFNLIFFQN